MRFATPGQAATECVRLALFGQNRPADEPARWKPLTLFRRPRSGLGTPVADCYPSLPLSEIWVFAESARNAFIQNAIERR